MIIYLFLLAAMFDHIVPKGIIYSNYKEQIRNLWASKWSAKMDC
jgi:hypothetical protein